MTEYKTFDDYVRNILKIEPTELTHISPEEQKKKTVEITVDELINIWNELTELKADNDARKFAMAMSEKVEKQLREENAKLRKVAEFQQSSNMNRYFENKKLKESLAVGSTFNKALNSINKNLEEERGKYRNMVFDKDDQLTKAKELLKDITSSYGSTEVSEAQLYLIIKRAEKFLKENK